MTFKSLLTLLPSFTIVAIIAIGCKDKSPQSPIFCSDGAESVNGSCQCKNGYYSFNNVCIEQSANSYVGINPSCNCYDTMVIAITGSGESRNFGMLIKAGNGSVGTLRSDVSYYETPSGDSLWTPELGYQCVINNVHTYPAIYGKKQSDGSWKLHLEFHDAHAILNVVDTCTIVARHL